MFDFVVFFPRAVAQGIPLLFGSTGEIITEKSGNLNLGIPGVMYVGGICGVIGSFLYERSLADPSQINAFLGVLIPILCCLLGSLLMGLLYCFLTVNLRANQNVTGLAMTTFGVGFGNFFGGSLIKLTGADVPSIALSTTSNLFRSKLPFADSLYRYGIYKDNYRYKCLGLNLEFPIRFAQGDYARMDAAHTVSLRTVFDNTLQVEAVYVVQRGKVKREAVQCQHLQSSMLTATPLSFTFSCDFEYQGLHYRLRGQYSANASAPQQSIRCIPLTLGKDLMEQGGYQK